MSPNRRAFYQAIKDRRLTSGEAMDMLQIHGVISDLCVTLDDIAEADLGNAIAFLTNNRKAE